MAGSYAIDVQFTDDLIVEVQLKPFTARLRTGDQLIAFERDDVGTVFTGLSRVDSTEDRREGGDDEVVVVRTAKIDPWTKFDTPRRLNVLAGSLEKVYRFLDPDRHFRRSIVKISPDDFGTIVRNTIYLDRTLFRYLFSSLPLAIQAEFVRSHIGQYPLTSASTINDYSELAPMLVSFLQDRIVPVFALMDQLSQMARKPFRSRLPDFSSLRLGTDEAHQVNGTDGRTPDIAIGSACTEASQFLRRSKLFPEEAKQSDHLLAESMRQLTIESPRKKWTDPIF